MEIYSSETAPCTVHSMHSQPTSCILNTEMSFHLQAPTCAICARRILCIVFNSFHSWLAFFHCEIHSDEYSTYGLWNCVTISITIIQKNKIQYFVSFKLKLSFFSEVRDMID